MRRVWPRGSAALETSTGDSGSADPPNKNVSTLSGTAANLLRAKAKAGRKRARPTLSKQEMKEEACAEGKSVNAKLEEAYCKGEFSNVESPFAIGVAEAGEVVKDALRRMPQTPPDEDDEQELAAEERTSRSSSSSFEHGFFIRNLLMSGGTVLEDEVKDECDDEIKDELKEEEGEDEIKDEGEEKGKAEVKEGGKEEVEAEFQARKKARVLRFGLTDTQRVLADKNLSQRPGRAEQEKERGGEVATPQARRRREEAMEEDFRRRLETRAKRFASLRQRELESNASRSTLESAAGGNEAEVPALSAPRWSVATPPPPPQRRAPDPPTSSASKLRPFRPPPKLAFSASSQQNVLAASASRACPASAPPWARQSTPQPPPSRSARGPQWVVRHALAILPGKWECEERGKMQHHTVTESNTRCEGDMTCETWEKGPEANGQWRRRGAKKFPIFVSLQKAEVVWGEKGSVWLDLDTLSQNEVRWKTARGPGWHWTRAS